MLYEKDLVKTLVAFDDVEQNVSMVRIVSVIIRYAIDGRASDVHIEPMDRETRVRYRIDGVLKTSLVLPRSIHNAIVERIKIMTNLKPNEKRLPQDGRIKIIFNDYEYDVRVSVIPLLDSEKVVMRVYDSSIISKSLKNFNYNGKQLNLLNKILTKNEGLVIIADTNNSRKSAVLASMLNIINKENANIATLEDPIEYEIKGVNQSQIRPDIGYTFASGLRSFLRQDLDAVLVSEIRDAEVGDLTAQLAMKGRLVLSSVHASSAIGAITKLIQMGIEPFFLGTSLRAVVTSSEVVAIDKNLKDLIIAGDVSKINNYLNNCN